MPSLAPQALISRHTNHGPAAPPGQAQATSQSTKLEAEADAQTKLVKAQSRIDELLSQVRACSSCLVPHASYLTPRCSMIIACCLLPVVLPNAGSPVRRYCGVMAWSLTHACAPPTPLRQSAASHQAMVVLEGDLEAVVAAKAQLEAQLEARVPTPLIDADGPKKEKSKAKGKAKGDGVSADRARALNIKAINAHLKRYAADASFQRALQRPLVQLALRVWGGTVSEALTEEDAAAVRADEGVQVPTSCRRLPAAPQPFAALTAPSRPCTVAPCPLPLAPCLLPVASCPLPLLPCPLPLAPDRRFTPA